MRTIRRVVNYPNVLSTLALVVATSGGAYAVTAQLARNSVGSAQLKNYAVTTPKIKNGAVTRIKLANGVVGRKQLASGSVGTGQLAHGSVGASQLISGAVGTGQLASGSITGSKLAPGLMTYDSGWNTVGSITTATFDGSNVQSTTITAPQVTPAVVNDGSVQVYVSWGSGTVPLPYTSYAGGKVSTLEYVLKSGTITINRFTSDNSGSVPISPTLQYRFVIAPTESGYRPTSP